MPSSLRSAVAVALLLTAVSAHGVYEKGSDVVLYANKVCLLSLQSWAALSTIAAWLAGADV
jgi:hypothetical protein